MYLRHFCGVSVGGPGVLWGTSDTFAVFLSEVQVVCGVPPTLLPCFCRRSRCFVGYLRHFCRVSVGGPGVLRGTSDTFAVFLSEVQVFCGVPPTLLPCFCRRWAQSKPCEPLGRARAACFEWSALVSADRGAVDGEFLPLLGTEICQIVYAVVGEYAG